MSKSTEGRYRWHAATCQQPERKPVNDLAPLIRVTDVRVLSRYIVELHFEDDAVRVIDLEPLLWGEMFAPLAEDYGLFRQVSVDPDGGTICWPSGADLSPRMLYAESKAAIPA